MKKITDSPPIYTVLLAAGKGTRFGGKKQFIKVNGQYLIEKPIRTLLASHISVELLVVAAKEDIPEVQRIIEGMDFHFPIPVIAGGKERFHSVQHALDQLAERAQSEDILLIHDAARPYVSTTAIQALIHTLQKQDPQNPNQKIQAASLAFPVTDTIKKVANPSHPSIAEHLDRNVLWAMQTPQAFRFGLLYESYKQLACDAVPTDDTMVIPAHIPIYLVKGNPENKKITYPEDIELG